MKDIQAPQSKACEEAQGCCHLHIGKHKHMTNHVGGPGFGNPAVLATSIPIKHIHPHIHPPTSQQCPKSPD